MPYTTSGGGARIHYETHGSGGARADDPGPGLECERLEALAAVARRAADAGDALREAVLRFLARAGRQG